MSEYRATIGLEIHAELSTKSKMFCACKNDPDEKAPNTNVCPVCMAHPGSLPVINQDAVRKVLLVGTALGSRLADYSEFDRKNYFYPDIPKDYQISQYAYPLVVGGELHGVALTRIHLEEDTARSQHEGEESFIDYNRAGLPLMELVTEPCIHDAEKASSFARELQLLLRYLGCGEANMEKGEMRVEANISVSKTDTLGTKVEVKNLNSFKAVERAVAYEIARQTKVLERGESITQETRGWDEAKQQTFSQRTKESSEDYRYFPDPDLPKLRVSEVSELSESVLRSQLGELPWDKRHAYRALGLSEQEAELYVRDRAVGEFFDIGTKDMNQGSIKRFSNYLSSDILGKRDAGEVPGDWFISENAERLAKLMDLIEQHLLSSRGAKDTLAFMLISKDDPKDIAKANNLIQESNSAALEEVIRRIVAANPSVAADFKAGKVAALQFLIGQAMKETKGAANPQLLKEIFEKVL